jgi:hypothetical protein
MLQKNTFLYKECETCLLAGVKPDKEMESLIRKISAIQRFKNYILEKMPEQL